MRGPVLGVVVAVLVAAVGAVILGEYELSGGRPLLAGVLFGVTVAEVIASTAGPAPTAEDDLHLLGTAPLITEAGLVWATWISTGHELERAATTAWIGVGLGMLASLLWLRSAGRRGARIPDEPTPSPGG
jgi:hypothetical protein